MATAEDAAAIREAYEGATGKPWPESDALAPTPPTPRSSQSGRLPAPPSSRRPARARRLSKLNFADYSAAVDARLMRTRIKAMRPAVDTKPPPQYKHLQQKLKHHEHELAKQKHINNGAP
jgi:hypothetical protein